MIRSILIMLLLGMAGILACDKNVSIRVEDQRPVYRDPVYEAIPVGHVCTRHCYDHYYDGSRVVVVRGGHRHGPNCGHKWNGRYWVSAEHKARPVVHVCSNRCRDHYWDGSRLVYLTGHRHRPGCGHFWNGTHWVVVSTRPYPHGQGHGHAHAHVCTRACRNHYYDGRTVVTIKGHRHGPGCGHYWDGTYWVRVRR
jgi:hypothetical protein